MKTILLRWALIVVFSGLEACSLMPPAESVATSEASHTYVMAGAGEPTVVFESGLGNGKEVWAQVFDQVAAQTRAIAYDRAGYGASRSTNRYRDGATIVRELRSTLRALHVNPPYILVGHSIGGAYMELYARTYPEEVAGVVLVDSRHADFTRQCQIADAGNCSPPAILSALMEAGPRREMEAGDRTMDQVMNAGEFPNVPLAVLSGGKQLLVGEKFYAVWLETQKSLASLSSQSTHRICSDCGHFVQRDNPELLISEITAILDQVRMP